MKPKQFSEYLYKILLQRNEPMSEFFLRQEFLRRYGVDVPGTTVHNALVYLRKHHKIKKLTRPQLTYALLSYRFTFLRPAKTKTAPPELHPADWGDRRHTPSPVMKLSQKTWREKRDEKYKQDLLGEEVTEVANDATHSPQTENPDDLL